jgi:hypothetical protein
VLFLGKGLWSSDYPLGESVTSWELTALIRPLGEILLNLMALTKFEKTPITRYI